MPALAAKMPRAHLPRASGLERRGRQDGIRSAICQLRSETLQRWTAGESRARKHGMCTGPARPLAATAGLPQLLSHSSSNIDARPEEAAAE